MNMMPLRYGNLQVNDRPDLHDRDRSIGVEVSRCSFGKNGEKAECFQKHLINVLSGRNTDKSLSILRRMISDEEWSHNEDYMKFMLGGAVPLSELSIEQIQRFQYRLQGSVEGIEAAVDRKVLKLDSYSKFDTYDLFLFTDEWITGHILERVKRYIFDKCTRFYSLVYLLSHGNELFIFDTSAGDFRSIQYPKGLGYCHAELAMYLCDSHKFILDRYKHMAEA